MHAYCPFEFDQRAQINDELASLSSIYYDTL